MILLVKLCKGEFILQFSKYLLGTMINPFRHLLIFNAFNFGHHLSVVFEYSIHKCITGFQLGKNIL